MAVAPHLVAEAVRLGVIRADDTHRFLFDDPPDPTRDMTYAQRLAYTIRTCSSGVAAITNVAHIVEHIPSGRTLPPPPKESR